MEKIKSILYTRISTEKIEQKTSYEQQLKFKDDRFDIVKVFDDKASGTSLKKRTGLIELLNFIGITIEFERDDYIFRIEHRTDIEVIICSSTSRLGRNTKDVQRLIDIIHKNFIKLYFIDINSFSDNEQIEILLNIYFTLDSQYSKELSRKVKYGMKRLEENENMIFCGGSIKGYTLKAGKLVKNEESEMIFNIYNDYVYNNIAIRGIATKYGINSTTASNILKNKKYAGYNKSDDKEISPNIEPIISLELFEKSQKIRLSRTSNSTKRGINTNTYALSGKCICPLCGFKLAFQKGRNNWKCHTEVERGRKFTCKRPSISENRINQYLNDMVASNQWREFIEFQIKLKLDSIHLIDVEVLNNDINQIDTMLSKLLDLYLNDELEKDIYMNRKDKLEQQKNKLESEIKVASDTLTYKLKLEKLRKEYLSKLDNIENLIINRKFKEIHQLIKNIYFAYNYDIKKPSDITNLNKVKKRLFVSKVIFKDFDILDNFEI